MDIQKYLAKHNIFLDGGSGTYLQARGLKPGMAPESLNIDNPNLVYEMHKAYFEAGSNIVATNTFGVNILKYSYDKVKLMVETAVDLAKCARKDAKIKSEKWIALDIGPSGHMIKPLGDLAFEDAVNAFKKTIELGVRAGVDLILIETFNDAYETKAALIAAKETTSLPVILLNSYDETGKLLTGADPEVVCVLAKSLGAFAVGLNCSVGPDKMVPVVRKMVEFTDLPIVVKPNAGMPVIKDGQTSFELSVDDFTNSMVEISKLGVSMYGGCCGTTPDYIKSIFTKIGTKTLDIKRTANNERYVTSGNKLVEIGKYPVVIGERINPTGKKKLKEAIINSDVSYILNEAISQDEAGSDILDVNVGIPDINEAEFMQMIIPEIQSVTSLPLCIDSSNYEALERAMRVYNGVPLVNSVNGKRESIDKVLPLVKKYGGVLIALCLDERGIPESPNGRLEIAQKIKSEAQKQGICADRLMYDALALPVSANADSAKVTLDTIVKIKANLNGLTSLGVSNVSFGLPNRDEINSAFLSMLISNGLDAAIINPKSVKMMNTIASGAALSGKDKDCTKFISYSNKVIDDTIQVSAKNIDPNDLKLAIIQGRAKDAETISRNKVVNDNVQPLELLNTFVIPALDEVGKGFESGKKFLPELLMSAEAAKQAFLVTKEFSHGESGSKGPFVIATVHGDIHDIGKNIVRLILENYGFNVIDLGKDVPPSDILRAVRESNAPICGLSALMTTTVPSMEETIKILREGAPDCKIIVGGAVLSEEYARKIGADFYASDAMDTVRIAERIIE